MATESPTVRSTLRQFLSLERDVLVLSLAMFAFSLGFQMTGRYLSEYLVVLGASPFIVGLYGSFGNVISAVYPYAGGVFSDRVGSRSALTFFGLLSTLGFLVWLVAPLVGPIDLGPLVAPVGLGGLVVEPWVWIFVGLVLAQAWKSFGLGATFAIVKQSVADDRLARGFASTETFRRSAFLLGPVLAAGLLFVFGGAGEEDILPGFLYVLALAVGFGALATVVQHVRYENEADSFGKAFEGVAQIRSDLADLPDPLRPLLVADTFVRFANGMVYGFFILVITRIFELDVTLFGVYLNPAVFFGLLLGVEMVVALVSMAPAAIAAERVGLKPVVAVGFAVYAVFPATLIFAPADPLVVTLLFAFSGLRFAGLPSHKALIVGPAERDAGGRVTGAYYLLRNTIVIPSAALGGYLYDSDWVLSLPVGPLETLTAGPELAFSVATVAGVIGVAYFLVFGEEFEAYA